jgi:hypothetical protein
MTHSDYINIIQSKQQLARHGQGPSEAQLDAMKAAAENAAADFDRILDGIQAGVTQRGAFIQTQLFNALSNGVTDAIKAFTFLEERNKNLNNSLGMTTDTAADLGQQLDTLSENLSVGGEGARVLAISLNGIAGGLINATTMQTKFGKSMLTGQDYMRNQLKVTEAAAQGYELYAAGLGKSAADQLLAQGSISKEIEKATDLTGVQRDLTETIGGLTADLQMQYSRIPGSMELAILKSRALGMSMADLNKTGQNLLNIESSIGQELEYQLLTGNRLVDEVSGESLTNAYREATFRGDANKQAEIMNQLLEQEGGTLENNLLARQQMAKLLGTDEATIARSLQKKELLAQLGAEDIMSLSGDKYEQRMKELGEEVKNDPKKEELFAELLKASDTRTSTERAADAMEKAATAIINNIPGGSAKAIKETTAALTTETLKDTATAVANTISTSPPFVAITQAAGTYFSVATLLKATVTGLKDLISTGIVTRTATGGMSSQTPTTSAKDAIIQFDPQDKFMQVGSNTMLASTDRGQLNVAAQTLSGAGNSSISSNDMQMMANMITAAISQIKLTANVETPLGSSSELNNGRFA